MDAEIVDEKQEKPNDQGSVDMGTDRVRGAGPNKDQQPTEMFRLRVPGGWLVAAAWGGIQPGGLVLLPDHGHEWSP